MTMSNNKQHFKLKFEWENPIDGFSIFKHEFMDSAAEFELYNVQMDVVASFNSFTGAMSYYKKEILVEIV